MHLEQEYVELASAADDAGPEAVPWTLGTAADRSLLFRIDVEPPHEATLALGDDRIWRVRLVLGDGEERIGIVGRSDDFRGVLRGVALALLEAGEWLTDAGRDGELAFAASALDFALAVDEKPVVAAASEAIGRYLIASGNEDEGAQLLEEYAIPALRSIGQEHRAEALRRLIG